MMLRSASFLLRTIRVAKDVSHGALPCVRSGVMTSRLFCEDVKRNKAKKVKKVKKIGEPEENDKEEEWISNLIDTAEAVRK